MSQEPKQVTIVINGQQHTWPKTEISYEDVAKLAYPDSYSPSTVYTIKYSKGHGEKPEGNLIKGSPVKVKDGMTFTAKDTGES